MKLALALLLNAWLLLAFAWWVRRAYRQATPSLRPWLLPVLGWRLLLTAISGSYPSIDAKYMSYWGQALATQCWAQPGRALALWQGEIAANGLILGKYSLSNTVFVVKLLSLLNLASQGVILLNALYLSMFCFVGCWLLVRTWAQLFPATPVVAVVAVLLWPSVAWWTAGLSKETVLVGSEAALVALVLQQLYAPQARATNWLPALGRLLAGVALAWLAYRMRYLFALPLLGGLLVLALVRVATQRGWLPAAAWAQAAATLLALGLGGGLGLWGLNSRVSDGFYRKELYTQYVYLLAVSANRPHLEYAHLAPTASSMVRYAPAAVAQVVVRPWLGESRLPLYVGVSLENLALLVLLGVAAGAVVRGRPGRLPVALVVLLLAYFLLVAALIGLSTPNLGTLHRYRAALLPWLLLLLLHCAHAGLRPRFAARPQR